MATVLVHSERGFWDQLRYSQTSCSSLAISPKMEKVKGAKGKWHSLGHRRQLQIHKDSLPVSPDHTGPVCQPDLHEEAGLILQGLQSLLGISRQSA